ncbi:low-density lipoprotein receptor-related protein 3-like [Branchiostoma floridae]|uniref:Low-density lipoprotein receptor-related protein 3-like n=1 Tax=Branchiostoma floridae TaxID=7739 RepID=A0A9J7LQ67_BRAFL|nr:low-density lipoprotein receptor-related protein 3-like [Branchiostoma floridae]
MKTFAAFLLVAVMAHSATAGILVPTTYIKSRCNQTTSAASGGAGFIEWSAATADNAETCSLTLSADVGSMFRLTFTRFDLDSNGQACVDTINILDGPNMLSVSKTGGDVCTQPMGEITTVSNTVTISFTQGSSDIDFMKFKIQYSVFRMAVLGMCTSSSDFKCDNNRCIDNDNKCDFRDDCGDNSDESTSDSGANCADLSDFGNTVSNFLSLGLAAIIGIVVGVIVLIILIIVLICVCCCNCCRKGNNQAV